MLVARDPERAQATLGKLAGSGHATHIADLSRLSEMKRVSAEIAAEFPQIDVLINNAGALFNTRHTTEDGLEMTFATNHMAYFVVTNVLLPNLKAGARIVSTASDAHKGAHLDFADLQSEKRYSGFSVYGKSKLCNILFKTATGAGASKDRASPPIALHPGFVATRFGDRSGGDLPGRGEDRQADRRDLARGGRQDHRLSRHCARRGRQERWLLLQEQAGRADERRAERR